MDVRHFRAPFPPFAFPLSIATFLSLARSDVNPLGVAARFRQSPLCPLFGQGQD